MSANLQNHVTTADEKDGGGTSIIDISVNNGQNGPIFHKETSRHTRDK